MTRRRKEVHLPVKIGTMPRSVVWMTVPDGGFKVGKTVEWRDMLSDFKWQEGRIWQIGPPPEYMLYIEL